MYRITVVYPNGFQVIFVDSLNILNASLRELGHSFNSPVKKGAFSYGFVNENRLNYIGKKPLLFDYKNQITYSEYIEIPSTD